MDPDFMRGERVAEIAPKCTECGKAAEGNHSWADGSGEICDACADKDALAWLVEKPVDT